MIAHTGPLGCSRKGHPGVLAGPVSRGQTSARSGVVAQQRLGPVSSTTPACARWQGQRIHRIEDTRTEMVQALDDVLAGIVRAFEARKEELLAELAASEEKSASAVVQTRDGIQKAIKAGEVEIRKVKKAAGDAPDTEILKTGYGF